MNLCIKWNPSNQSFLQTAQGLPVYPGTDLLNASVLAVAIQFCQAKGKIVTISLGGSSGSIGFSDDIQAKAFAQTIWDLFLGGESNTRPFGSAVLDGWHFLAEILGKWKNWLPFSDVCSVDLDIEGGSQTGYTAFVTALRGFMGKGSKQWVIYQIRENLLYMMSITRYYITAGGQRVLSAKQESLTAMDSSTVSISRLISRPDS